jgi:chemotaxis protein CheD
MGVEVRMGCLSVSNEQNAVLTTFVGSCVAVSIYEPMAKIGGLAHVMLPDSGGKNLATVGAEAKYADHAIEILWEKMIKLGAKKEHLSAKLVGGARTFSDENGAANNSLFNIGDRNCTRIRSLLSSYKIPIVAEDVGSTQGRWVKLYINNGSLTVKKRTDEVYL